MSRFHLLAIGLIACSSPVAWGQNGVPRQAIVLEVDRPVLDAVEKPIDLHLIEQPLDLLPEILAEHGINVTLDLKAFDDVGIGRDAPVSINVRGVSLRAALDALLRPLDLTWTVRDGILLITTPEEEENLLSTRTYDVSDLAPVELYDGIPERDFDRLIEMITRTVAPNTWDEVGGPSSVSGYAQGDAAGLVISQTVHVHRELDELFWQLRQLPGHKRKSTTSASAEPLPSAPPRRTTRQYLAAPHWTRQAIQPR